MHESNASAATAAASAGPAAAPRWWREPMMWLVVGGPVAVVLASVFTAFLAVSGADVPLSSEARRAAHVRMLEPALKARNAAAADGAAQAAAAAAGRAPAAR